MRLLGPRLHIRPLPQATKSAGGIDYMPSYRDDDRQFEVLAVGPGYRKKDGTYQPLEVSPGDRLLVRGVHGNEMVFEDGSQIIHATEAILSWR